MKLTSSPMYSYSHIHWKPVTLTVISESRTSYIAISLVVAGNAITTRMITGITVQMISAVVLWLNWEATAPLDLRNLNIA